MLDAVRGYLHAASGLTELTRKRAQELAQSVIASGGAGLGGAAVAGQVSAVADELISAARSNRAAVREMVRGEVEVAVGRLGLVPATELAKAHQQIAALESAVAELRRGSAGPTAPAAAQPSARARVKRAAVKRDAVKRDAVKRAAHAPAATAPADTSVAKKSVAKKSVAKKSVAKKVPAGKSVAKKVPAGKSVAKQVPAKKSAKKSVAKRAST